MLRHWIDIDNLNGRFLSMNPRAISLLEQHPEKIDWYWLSGNPNAVPLLEKNLDKVDWSMLSSNPNAVHLLKKNLDKVDWLRLSDNHSAEAMILLEPHLDKLEDQWNLLCENPFAINLLYNAVNTQMGHHINWVLVSGNPEIFEDEDNGIK